MTLLVGLDFGSTSVKAVVYEPDGRAVARAAVATPTYYPRPGWAYYEPDEVWGAAVGVLREALAGVEDRRRIAGIAVTSVGEAIVPLDDRGEPTSRIIAWFDTRTRPQADWLDRVIGKDELFARSGLSLQPIFSLCKVLWLKEHEPDAWGRTTRWLLLADWLAYRLCGAQAAEHSLASRTLAFNLHDHRWDEATIRAAGLDPAIFPILAAGGTRLGSVTAEAAAETGLPQSAIVAAGGHDHVCGAFAAGVVEPGTMLNSIGTAEAVFMPLDRPIADPRAGREGYTQGAHVVGNRPYVFGGLYTSGAAVEWLRRILVPELASDNAAAYAALIALAEGAPPGSLGVTFLPHLRLANPPADDPKSRGTFVGLTTDTTREALARALFEGLAFESRHTLDALLAYPEVVAPTAIAAVSGGARNRLLMRIKASVVDQPHEVLHLEEATALGAALLAGLGAGVYLDVAAALASVRSERTVVAPDADLVSLYETIYQQVYRRLYETVAPLSHTIVDVQASLGLAPGGESS